MESYRVDGGTYLEKEIRWGVSATRDISTVVLWGYLAAITGQRGRIGIFKLHLHIQSLKVLFLGGKYLESFSPRVKGSSGKPHACHGESVHHI